jgi:hypothetical protein
VQTVCLCTPHTSQSLGPPYPLPFWYLSYVEAPSPEAQRVNDKCQTQGTGVRSGQKIMQESCTLTKSTMLNTNMMSVCKDHCTLEGGIPLFSGLGTTSGGTVKPCNTSNSALRYLFGVVQSCRSTVMKISDTFMLPLCSDSALVCPVHPLFLCRIGQGVGC